jgi:hypothetical protein
VNQKRKTTKRIAQRGKYRIYGHDVPEQTVRQGGVSAYVKNVDLISLRLEYKYKEDEGK